MSVILFIVVLSVLVLSHEFGHFIVAKMAGLRVDEFGFGFPPKLFGVTRGETTYTINLLPLGGFVRIFGENDETPTDGATSLRLSSRGFASKPRVTQAAVVIAGVLFNLLLAWALFSFGFLIGLPTSVDSETNSLPLSNVRLLITDVRNGSPASGAQLRAGDEIIAFGEMGKPLVKHPEAQAVQTFIAANGDKPLTLTIRNGRKGVGNRDVIVTPRQGIIKDRAVIGISMEMIGVVRLGPFRAIVEGFTMTLRTIDETARSLASFAKSFFVGKARDSLAAVTGPIGIISIVGEAAQYGFVQLLTLVAFISINLAVVNLLPFPALDGGRLLFIVVEGLRGKPLNSRLTTTAHNVGFVLLLFLMLIITFHDLAKLTLG